MKKLFNYALLAAALLIGVNVNAQTPNADAIEAGLATGSYVIPEGGDVDFVIERPLVLELEAEATLDLNGHNLVYAYNYEAFKEIGDTDSKQGRMINLKKGVLNVVNNKKATGGNVENRTEVNAKYSFLMYKSSKGVVSLSAGSEVVVFSVTGDPATTAPAKESVYTKLCIAPEVTVTTPKGKVGIIVNRVNDKNITYVSPVDVAKGSAFGVVVEVAGKVHGEKYGIQLSGNVNASPVDFGKDVAFPFIWIKSTAEVWANPTVTENGNGLYLGGYCVCTINGYVHGSNGVYIKSGDVTIEDAVIKSDNPNYSEIQGKGSGTEGSGNAIVIESNSSYAGTTEVNISGDTKVEAESGYAIQEVITKGGESKVEDITINGGTFIGGDEKGAIVISQDTKEDVVINAGSFSDGSANDYINQEGGIITEITDAEGNVIGTVITTDKCAPDDKTNYLNKTDIKTKNYNYLYWEKPEQGAGDAPFVDIEKGDTVTLHSFTANWGHITIKDGGTLIFDVIDTIINEKDTIIQSKVILNGTAYIDVLPGATLISMSKNGVETASVVNLWIGAQEGKMAQFFYHPDVNQGRHPKATVEFHSKAKGLSTWDRFGVPAYEGMTLSQMACATPGLQSYLFTWNNVRNDWDQVKSSSYLMKPFEGLTLTNNSEEGGAIYQFPCEIVGNVDATLELVDNWNALSNSYTAKTDIKAFMDAIMEHYYYDLEAQIVTYVNGNDDIEQSWEQITFGTIQEPGFDASKLKLDPMQAFILRKMTTKTVVGSINYRENVWNPAMENEQPKAPAAPRQMMNMNKVVINLIDAQGHKDNLIIREASEFSADFDNGYDATLYESASKFNFYAATDYAHQSEIATNDIEGQVLTLATKGETSFTMSFSNVLGEKMAIRDNMTGDVIEMAEGVTYNFMANANEVSERFTIIAAAQAPTAIQKAEASAKAAKFFRHDQVVLQNNGRLFNVLGAEVK